MSTLDTLGSKWFIYMTNQGIGLLTLHYLVYAGGRWQVAGAVTLAGIVLGRRLGGPSVPQDGLPALYSFSWGLQTTFTTVALWITIIYWTALHPYVVEFDLIQGAWMHALNYFLHLVSRHQGLIYREFPYLSKISPTQN